jgi:hypothetical protein
MSKPLLQIDGEIIPVRVDEQHEYVLETALVAKGYGVSPEVIRSHKRNNAAELIKGKHWISVENLNADTRAGHAKKTTVWTKRGIITLGFFIKSERAKKFRELAADLIIKATEPKQAHSSSIADMLDRAAAEIRAGSNLGVMLESVMPKNEFGTLSEKTGLPRTRLMPSYFTSRYNRDERTARYLEAKQRQMDFEADLALIAEVEGSL